MKQIIFHVLCILSYLLRPLRHNLYKKVLQYAYELHGVKFRGSIGYIHHDVYIDNVGKIEIGKNVVISTKSIILAHDYSYKVKEYVNTNSTYSPFSFVEIGDNCFIGAGAIILPGTTIGSYCIIGAGAVVKGTFPDYSIIAGNPAKIIKMIK